MFSLLIKTNNLFSPYLLNYKIDNSQTIYIANTITLVLPYIFQKLPDEDACLDRTARERLCNMQRS